MDNISELRPTEVQSRPVMLFARFSVYLMHSTKYRERLQADLY